MDFKALLEPKKQAKKECKTGTKTVNAGEFMLLAPSPVLLVLDRLRGIEEHIIRPRPPYSVCANSMPYLSLAVVLEVLKCEHCCSALARLQSLGLEVVTFNSRNLSNADRLIHDRLLQTFSWRRNSSCQWKRVEIEFLRLKF